MEKSTARTVRQSTKPRFTRDRRTRRRNRKIHHRRILDIIAVAQFKEHAFNAKLAEYQQEKLTQFSITSSEQTEQIKQNLLKAAQKQTELSRKVEKKQRKRNPAAPFTTSTLQLKEAARK